MKGLKECEDFEELVTSRNFKQELLGATALLEPFSLVLHYLEGDSIPVSHVYPCFQFMYDFNQQ